MWQLMQERSAGILPASSGSLLLGKYAKTGRSRTVTQVEYLRSYALGLRRTALLCRRYFSKTSLPEREMGALLVWPLNIL